MTLDDNIFWDVQVLILIRHIYRCHNKKDLTLSANRIRIAKSNPTFFSITKLKLTDFAMAHLPKDAELFEIKLTEAGKEFYKLMVLL